MRKRISVTSAPNAGRRQPRQNRQRVDVALVEDAEHDVDDHDGDDQQHREVAERALERLGRALELAAHAFGQRLRARPRARGVSTSPSDAPGARPNDIGDGRQLAVVVDGLRPD